MATTTGTISTSTRLKRNERLYGLSRAFRLWCGRRCPHAGRDVCHAGCGGGGWGHRLFATSHSTPGMEPFPRDVYQRHLDFARAYCAEKGYDLMLESGSGCCIPRLRPMRRPSTAWSRWAAPTGCCWSSCPMWRRRKWKRPCGRSPAAATGCCWRTLSATPALPAAVRCPPEGTVRHPLSGQCGHGAGGRILSAPEAGPLAEGRPCGRDLLGRT